MSVALNPSRLGFVDDEESQKTPVEQGLRGGRTLQKLLTTRAHLFVPIVIQVPHILISDPHNVEVQADMSTSTLT